MGTPGKLVLSCTGCGRTYAPPQLHCAHCDGLLRSRYESTEFRPKPRPGLFAFHDWLPSQSALDLPIGAVVRPSQGFGPELGLRNLSIAFSGYAPEIDAWNPTGSFKDFEAAPSLQYYREHGINALILASAGNTARAFAYAAVKLDYPVILVVPERAVERLWIPCRPTERVRLVVLEGCDDYAAAIRAAAQIGTTLGISNEGGARNVARRDGMSTSVLEYARTMGSIPEHYVQAVGSGTGAIAAWEASLRLAAAGVGDKPPVLHLAQNDPFAPIHDAWAHHRPIDPDRDVEDQLLRIDQIDALVLANRTPPYGIPGGVHAALTATAGHTYAITNDEARATAVEFESLEGLSIGPAAAVAAGALRQAVRINRIASNDRVLLHITGNNEVRLRQDYTLQPIPVSWRVRPKDLTERAILSARGRLGVAAPSA
jgi:cysteate synthase